LIILLTGELATTAVIETLNESDKSSDNILLILDDTFSLIFEHGSSNQFSDIDLEDTVINEKILIIISTT